MCCMPDSPVANAPHHALLVRVTHWITTLCFVALLVTGAEILISHPRFYWGETGNVKTPALFQLPIPASRGAVQTGYGYVLRDQNGWSRALHFQSAWLLVGCGLFYLAWAFAAGHFRAAAMRSYNPLQRRTYLAVIFLAFPLLILTGLAMSPGFTSALPIVVNVFGGQQSARTIHFFLTLGLLIFVIGHVVMVWRNGFYRLVSAMITGQLER